MSDNPWTWQEGRNPYRSTPLQILALDPDVEGRAAIKAHIRKRRGRITRAPERHRLFGRELSPADVNEAEEKIVEPRGRLLAELRTHRPERPLDTPRFSAEVDALPEPPVPEPQTTVRSSRVAALAPEPVPRVFKRRWSL